MGYYRGTRVSCTNPDLIASGSTFNQEWADFIIGLESGVTIYHCRKEYLNDAIVELSKQHPDVSFTGVTWTDDDFEDSIDFTLIIKNGEFKVVKMAPHYQILFPVIDDEEYKSLTSKFKEQIDLYLNRLDIVREDSKEGVVFDFLNDKVDKDGFWSYYIIVWEDGKQRFTATKRFTSQVTVDYHRKKPDSVGNSGIETDSIKTQQVDKSGQINNNINI
ncbi:MAG: hypothetical protein NTV31_11625 [Bacteroidia bacterium]|nr:hypothetical protein [Bacteroidia bacterium]